MCASSASGPVLRADTTLNRVLGAGDIPRMSVSAVVY